MIAAQGIEFFEIPTSIGNYVEMQLTVSSGLAEAYVAYVDYGDEVASFYNV